ncbi:MAG: colanic acid biosynthesis glycosyltransferase WcaL [Alphaproteobacteria bacterium]|nr:colanic acid biosynthesis glycosyltransferase WcaL [Alphaproteobacteria bacterium]|tara:strand:+ start:18970 stop:20238 length:1269 start_codon:yes stop_codon:yes gene_type:complete
MKSVAFILKGYPRLSETFIAQEIRSLELRGLEVEIVSLRHPTDTSTHPIHGEIKAPVNYLPEYLYAEPVRVLKALFTICRQPKFRTALRVWFHDLLRDPTPNRVRRFGQAAVLAADLTPHVTHLYAHFLHTPASVARYASIMTGLPWSVSAHAKDIWTIPDWEKREKLADCDWAVTCTASGHEHLTNLAPSNRVHLVYHGLDLDRFPPPEKATSLHDGSDSEEPVVLLCVGRAVEKKGLDTLVTALHELPSTIAWRFIHIGGGPELNQLKHMAENLGLGDRVIWLGPQPQKIVLENYRSADLFVLPSVIAKNGDRDGLPNVLLEAQSQGVACISARLPGISELIADDTTGILIDPGDVTALSAAISNLAQDPQRRRQLGTAALRRVREHFSLVEHIGHLASLFGLSPAEEDQAECKLRSTAP